MSEYEEYGHCSITQDGKLHQSTNKPSNWMIHYYFGENDGWRLMRRGRETKIITEINRDYSAEEVRELVKKCKENNLINDKDVISRLEERVKIL